MSLNMILSNENMESLCERIENLTQFANQKVLLEVQTVLLIKLHFILFYKLFLNHVVYVTVHTFFSPLF